MENDEFSLERFIDSHPDTGCRAAPCCLSCPLPRCKYDFPTQDEVIAVMERERLIVSFAAVRFGISESTIRRMVRDSRRERQEVSTDG